MDNKMTCILKSFKDKDMDNEMISIAKLYKENKKQIKENKKQLEENINLIKASKRLKVGKKQIESNIKKIKANIKQIKEIEKNQEEILRNKANKKQIKEINKNQELLKFMKQEGYRIQVGEDTFMLFENEGFYRQMFYLERVYFYIYKQLFNKKEVLPIIFRLKTLERHIKYFLDNYKVIKIKVSYDSLKYVNPFKKSFPVCLGV